MSDHGIMVQIRFQINLHFKFVSQKLNYTFFMINELVV